MVNRMISGPQETVPCTEHLKPAHVLAALQMSSGALLELEFKEYSVLPPPKFLLESKERNEGREEGGGRGRKKRRKRRRRRKRKKDIIFLRERRFFQRKLYRSGFLSLTLKPSPYVLRVDPKLCFLV